MARSIQNYTLEIYSKDRYCQVSFVQWITRNRGSYGVNIVFLSLAVSVSQLNKFNEATFVLHLKNDNLIFVGISLYLGKKDPKMGHFVRHLESFVILFFLKQSEGRIIVILGFLSLFFCEGYLKTELGYQHDFFISEWQKN